MGLLKCLENEDKTRSDNIDRQLMREFNQSRLTLKLLLLGAGECGKSTVVKQMKIIYAKGFTDEQRKGFVGSIQENAVRAIKLVIEAMPRLGINFHKEDLQEEGRKVILFYDTYVKDYKLSEGIDSETLEHMIRITADYGFMECASRSTEFTFLDSAPYFLEHLRRVCTDRYVPTDTDILKCRVKTTGIIEQEFNVHSSQHNARFKVVDVGGQRVYRKKWLHCFEEVTAIIFVASLIDYDMVLEEDGVTNRMVESLKLFDSICNLKWFQDASIILFLNKSDLFVDRVSKSSLRKCFDEYTGEECNASQAYDYIKLQFESKCSNRKKGRRVYTHQTSATDTNALKFVLNSITEIIITKNLEEIGLN